ncbi:MAG TPA: hypothetical protein VLT90_13495 [Terriglobales bacterium]|nr:hypothetical protein [Terriglobales bacterium]
MTGKTSTWLIASGCFIAFVGLCFLPAAFGPDPDRTMLGAGSVILAMGLFVMSGGVYIKARAFNSGAPANAPSGKRARKAICDRCGQDEPVIQCRVHQVHLCGDCLAEHYDFRSCAYVPSTRRGTTKSTAVAYSQAASS